MSVICSHTGSVELPERIEGREECLAIGGTWVRLRICQSCGRIGCCERSPNRHACAHAGGSAHAIARSAQVGEDWSWCDSDGVAFVMDSERFGGGG